MVATDVQVLGIYPSAIRRRILRFLYLQVHSIPRSRCATLSITFAYVCSTDRVMTECKNYISQFAATAVTQQKGFELAEPQLADVAGRSQGPIRLRGCAAVIAKMLPVRGLPHEVLGRPSQRGQDRVVHAWKRDIVRRCTLLLPNAHPGSLLQKSALLHTTALHFFVYCSHRTQQS